MNALKLLALAAFALVPVLAEAAAPPASGPIQEQAVFCDGPYALCIKAPCLPVINESGETVSAVCSCVVELGYSMGPAACDARKPVVKNGRTFMMSTYSNYFNTQEKTLTCSFATQIWAWCYGAPCVVDPLDPKKTTCTCPVSTGTMQTLGGKCLSNSGGCTELWSAATPANNKFANDYFYAYMKKNHPNYPVNPPAAMCTGPTAK